MDLDNLAPESADPLLDRLAEQYSALTARTDELVGALARVPERIDEQSFDRAVGFVKQIKIAAGEAEKARKAEKDDFLQAGRKVDGFFATLVDRLKKTAAEVELRTERYLTAKADEERRKREEAARIAREAADAAAAEARRIREEEDRRRRDAEAAEAARIAALTPQVDPAEALEAQRKAAEGAERAGRERIAREAEALAAAKLAQDEAAEAERRANAKAADLARTRGALGGTATLATRIEFEILDRQAAVAVLWRYLDDEALAKACRALQRDHGPAIKASVKVGGKLFAGIRFFEKRAARVA